MTSIQRTNRVVRFLIGATGFEPATSWSQTKRSAKLSYAPWRINDCTPRRRIGRNLLSEPEWNSNLVGEDAPVLDL